MASPTAWSLVDHPGHGAHVNPVPPPTAELIRGATRTVFSRLLLPSHHFGLHFFGRSQSIWPFARTRHCKDP